MMSYLWLLLAVAPRAPIADPVAVQPDPDDGDLPWSPFEFNDYRWMPSEPDYLKVACPRCGAKVGKPCNRRTLGRHSEHWARVDAAYAERRASRGGW